MTNSFTPKLLQVTLTLKDGALLTDRGNTVVLKDLRMSAEIKKVGHPVKNTAVIKIYGMAQDLMNACTVVPLEMQPTKHPVLKKIYIKVEAGDASGLSQVFVGEVTEAYASYKTPPNMLFHIEAASGAYPVRLPTAPRGYSGPTSAEQIIKDIASSIGYGFQNNGFSAMLGSPYLVGTALEQVNQIYRAVPMELFIDDQVIYISPKNTPRNQVQIPVISAATGMKEYPIFDKHGLRAETLYNPGILYGGQVYVKSEITPACGWWLVNGLHHHLESSLPKGHWLTRINANLLKKA